MTNINQNRFNTIFYIPLITYTPSPCLLITDFYIGFTYTVVHPIKFPSTISVSSLSPIITVF